MVPPFSFTNFGAIESLQPVLLPQALPDAIGCDVYTLFAQVQSLNMSDLIAAIAVQKV